MATSYSIYKEIKNIATYVVYAWKNVCRRKNTDGGIQARTVAFLHGRFYPKYTN